ncbi:MAG: AAA family ATPase, partial [Acidaminococcaceae bacterium]|nr:AAA family ATPase [Acidaminococcaceae bacterium]
MERKIMNRLLAWKDKSDRKPLLLNGARQVGKTYILQKLGREHFDNMVYVNLEKNLLIAGFFQDNIDPRRIIRYLEAGTQEKIVPGKTLLVLDEIQACERALTALKYFCEEAPEYHVAAAGSLLGVAIHREKYSFPVGKVETVTLYPFDFEEYLLARQKDLLLQEIRNSFSAMTPLPDALHQEAVDLYREYLVIGGMPASIEVYLRDGSFLNVTDVQDEIVNSYVADMAKYANNTESVRIRACFRSVPAQLAKDNKKFQYKVVQRGGSAALFSNAIEWLAYAGVVLKCQKVQHAEEPLSVYADLSS